MKDVAERAGVSASTVSHVINGTRKLSDSAREGVLSAIEDLGYRRSTTLPAREGGRA